jgi:hypothetical protein
MKTIGDFVNGLNDGSCVECGRKVGMNPKWIHLANNGSILPKDSEADNSQGFWAVGSECAKKFDPKVLTA